MFTRVNRLFSLCLTIVLINQVASQGYLYSCCNSAPCQNGGICNPLYTGGYSCTCANGYFGINCQYNSKIWNIFKCVNSLGNQYFI